MLGLGRWLEVWWAPPHLWRAVCSYESHIFKQPLTVQRFLYFLTYLFLFFRHHNSQYFLLINKCKQMIFDTGKNSYHSKVQGIWLIRHHMNSKLNLKDLKVCWIIWIIWIIMRLPFFFFFSLYCFKPPSPQPTSATCRLCMLDRFTVLGRFWPCLLIISFL